MNAEENYTSNSEESDEDFCPDKEAGASDDAVSEESSDDAEDSQGEEAAAKVIKKTRSKKRVLVAKKTKKAKKKVNESQLEESEEADLELCSRRCTRQTDDSAVNGKRIEKDELESDEEDKSRTDALWADFLSDVKPVTVSSRSSAKAKIAKESEATATATAPAKLTNGSRSEKINEKPSVNSDANKEPTKKTVTEILDFAGEEVRVEKVVNADGIKEIKEGKAKLGLPNVGQSALQTGLKRSAGSGGGGGLGSILNQLGKKKKMSVLEKTQIDWKSFKQDEGIEEELLTHNKGKDGFLERQDFLQRTDVRQFEIEKSLRQSKRKN